MMSMPGHQMSNEMSKAIADSLECARACTETITHCLEKGGKHAEANHIKTLLDCAEACRTAADFMARGSMLHGEACLLCADACLACAESCEQVDANDPMMQACAKACRRCEASCRPMASTGRTRRAA